MMPSMRIVSPERWWRAVAAPLITGLIGWVLSGSFRLRGNPAPEPPPLTARAVVIGVCVAAGLSLAVLIMRANLTVSADGLADHRLFRVIRVPWQLIAGFTIDRPGRLWGGFGVTALRHDGTRIDLLSTRAYSRVPSAGHLDQLHQICWTLEQAIAAHS